jgi:hypothetical protein
MKYNKDNIKDLVLDKNTYYLYERYGSGDVMFLAGFKKEFEKKYNGRLHFIIKPNHEFLMKMYEISDYDIFDSDLVEYYGYTEKYFPIETGKILDISSKRLFISKTARSNHALKPLTDEQMGILLKFTMGKTNLELKNFRHLHTFTLGLDETASFEPPIWYPELSEKLNNILQKLNNKVILICPEAVSLKLLDKLFWENIVKEYNNLGYEVVCNVVKKENFINGCLNVDLSLNDSIALTAKIKTLSLRSGFTDIVCHKAKDLEVYYNNVNNFYSLNVIFENIFVKEKVINMVSINSRVDNIAENINKMMTNKTFFKKNIQNGL